MHLILISLLCMCLLLLPGGARQDLPPNIILINVDDMGYGDLGITGHPTILTPRLDAMARGGIQFTNFYSGSPACTASRYALLTGRVPARSGFDWVLYPASEKGIHPDEWTIAEALKSAGYATAAFGKWHLGSTRKEYLPMQNGFDEYLGLPYSNDMIPPKWRSIALLAGNDTLSMDPDQNGLTEAFTDATLAFIEKNTSRPFFIYVPYTMPHLPLKPGDAFKDTSQRGLYGDVIEEIDFSVGRILDRLAALDLSERTLVWFTSDNGPWLIKEHLGGTSGLLRDGKGSTWEGGMRVPSFAYWPGTIEARQVEHAVVPSVDLYPTLLGLANASMPTDRILDGKDIRPLLGWPGEVTEKPVFYYGPHALHAVRHGSWKLHIRTSSQLGIDYFNREWPLLFNLDEDPGEHYNLARQYPEIVAALQSMIAHHQQDLSSYWDQERFE